MLRHCHYYQVSVSVYRCKVIWNLFGTQQNGDKIKATDHAVKGNVVLSVEFDIKNLYIPPFLQKLK